MFKKLMVMTSRFSTETLSKVFITLLVVSSFLLGALWSQLQYVMSLEGTSFLNLLFRRGA